MNDTLKSLIDKLKEYESLYRNSKIDEIVNEDPELVNQLHEVSSHIQLAKERLETIIKELS